MRESFDSANEALEIAERCEYRLDQAEIHNFVAEWWIQKSVASQQSSDKTAHAEAIAKAKEHAERAKERAWCDGPPYHYKVAYERAESLLKTIPES